MTTKTFFCEVNGQEVKLEVRKLSKREVKDLPGEDIDYFFFEPEKPGDRVVAIKVTCHNNVSYGIPHGFDDGLNDLDWEALRDGCDDWELFWIDIDPKRVAQFN